MALTVQVRLPDSTGKLIKLHISEREKGLFRKGMIMDFVNKAVLRLIAQEKALVKEKIQASTHTQNQIKMDRFEQREQELSEEYERIHDAMLYMIKDAGWSPKLIKTQMDSLILRATNCKGRSLSNKYKELLAHGVISNNFNEYRVRERKSDTTSTPMM